MVGSEQVERLRDHQGGHVVGEEFSNKRLNSYMGKNKHGHHTWYWQCMSCGLIQGPSQISHMRRSTKCLECNKGPKSGRWKGYMSITGTFLYQYQHNANKRGLAWAVTPEELWELYEKQDRRCAYSQLSLTHGRDASLDRIDNKLGYVSGNVQWVHRDINRMKSDFTHKEFIRMCHRVANNTTDPWKV